MRAPSAAVLGGALLLSAASRAAAEEPAAPRADTQEPRPYLTPEAAQASRRVLLGVDLGMVQRPVPADARFSYAPAPIYVAHARLERLDWFGHEVLEFLDLRALAALNSHTVEARAGAEIDAPDVTMMQLGARAEPTWTVTPTLRLWVGGGVAWERLQMDAYDLPNGTHVPRRAGVAVEYSVGLGSIVDLIPNWLALELGVTVAWPAHQSGSLFDPVQTFDGEGRSGVDRGMPLFDRSHYGFAGLSVVL